VVLDKGSARNFRQVHRAQAFAGDVHVVDTILEVDNQVGDGREKIEITVASVKFERIGVSPATQPVIAGATNQEVTTIAAL